MLKLGFVFPGQGAQYVGMGKDLADNFIEAQEVFAAADRICGYALSSLCFEGPQEVLDQTQYAQPAILVTSLACLAVARSQGLSANLVSGLSLGEYTALVASGSLTLEQALPLVIRRAELMQEAVPIGKGAMAAIIGVDSALVEQICSQVEGVVTLANYNCPGQYVISGEKEAVDRAAEKLKQEGAKAIMLAISVPSHSPLMRDCAGLLALEIAKVNFLEPTLAGVVSNVNAQVNHAQDFPRLLEEQLYSPVRWEQSINYMLPQVDYFVEIGPGSSLSGLIKKIERNRVLGNIENQKSLQKLMEKVKSL